MRSPDGVLVQLVTGIGGNTIAPLHSVVFRPLVVARSTKLNIIVLMQPPKLAVLNSCPMCEASRCGCRGSAA